MSDELAAAIERITMLRLEVRVLQLENERFREAYETYEAQNRALWRQVEELKNENARLRSEMGL